MLLWAVVTALHEGENGDLFEAGGRCLLAMFWE